MRVLPLLLALAAPLPGCALLQPGVSIPSAPTEPAPSAADRTRAAQLLRDGQRAQNPPRGVRPDPDRAAALIEQAAILGDPEAQLLVAGAHLFRDDGGRDPAAAIPWLLRAAQQGQPEAQFRLARLIEAGDGTPREPAWAAVWFQRAAERGVVEAQFSMAMLQVAGIGTAQDMPDALARMRLAEQGGVTAARRYRQALEARVPAGQAAAALARVRGESVRGPVLAVDRPLVRFAQSGLLAIGLAPGLAVDGRDTPATRAALVDFARREGLQPGPYDPAVIDRLRALLMRR